MTRNASQESPAHHLSRAEARAVRVAAQGLPLEAGEPARPGDLLATIERTGFLRTLGGVDVYLAARARVPGLTAARLDEALLRGEVRVVPAVRGCIYLVSARHAPLALALAARLSASRNAREAEKAGIAPGELEELGQAVVEALERGGDDASEAGGMTTDALRRALPDGAVRSLGDRGKKLGLSSTLPPALRALELDGRIERIPATGRLDTERYLWGPARKSPVEPASVPADSDGLDAAVGEIFFRAAGVATRRDLAAWVGLNQGEAKRVVERLDLVPVAVEDLDETAYCHPDHRHLVASPPAPDAAAVSLLPFADGLVDLHGGPAAMVEPAHHGVEVPVWGRGKGSTLGDARHVSLRSVVAGGRIAGFWEYHPDDEVVVTGVFDPPPPADRAAFAAALDAAAADTGRFLREELGNGRSFSLDTDDHLRRRAEDLRSGSL